MKKKICKAINTKGKKCIVAAKGSSDYCFRHLDYGKSTTKNQKNNKKIY